MSRCSLLCLAWLSSSAMAAPPLTHEDIPAEEDGSQSSPIEPIVNGKEESGFPAAIGLGVPGFSMCSGSVVTPRVVISAGHCGDGLPIEIVLQFGSALFGPDANGSDGVIPLADMRIHPDYVPLGPAGMSQTLPEYDISVIELAEDAPTDPVWFNDGRLGKKYIGETVTSVGFGATSGSGGGSGTKRSARLTIDDIDDQFVLSLSSTNKDDANICSGDSGGPQYYKDPDTGEWIQLAVHSWGDAGCTYNSGSTRTDIAADFLYDFIEQVHGTTDRCVINGHYGDGICDDFCETPDPDCPIWAPDSPYAALAAGSGSEAPGGCDLTGHPMSTGWWLMAGVLVLRRRG